MRSLDRSLAGTPHEPFWQLVYRYWFWDWLFDDVNQGDWFRRAAAWQHNLRQRIHLPVYMRRWLACLVATFALACLLELVPAARVPAAMFYVGAILSATIEVFAGVAWLFLREVRAR
ncbi:MAG TPA: hypothetical protein VNG69_01430 [Casimicrobiaceae bacterium]|nr:hypothetical protein [Casimicrobiaceae bacterium]